MLDLLRTEHEVVHELIDHSFLENETKEEYRSLYRENLKRLNISASKKHRV
jgi:hypothetical protein